MNRNKKENRPKPKQSGKQKNFQVKKMKKKNTILARAKNRSIPSLTSTRLIQPKGPAAAVVAVAVLAGLDIGDILGAVGPEWMDVEVADRRSGVTPRNSVYCLSPAVGVDPVEEVVVCTLKGYIVADSLELVPHTYLAGKSSGLADMVGAVAVGLLLAEEKMEEFDGILDAAR